MDAAMEARLAELLDREAIRAVIQRMARGLDRLDNALVLSCYWPEAIDDHTHFVGRPEDFVRYADSTTLRFASCLHHLSTFNCEIDGTDAHAESYYVYTGHAAQPPHFMATGRYVDHFQKRGDEWRILGRVTIVDGQYELTPAAFAAAMPSPYAPGENPVARDRSDVSYQRPVRPRMPK